MREDFKEFVPKYSAISISQELLQTIFEGAKSLYPKETILMLRGEKKKDIIVITELLVPPLASYGRGFANIRLHMLPMEDRKSVV